jgi:hypothetical protein
MSEGQILHEIMHILGFSHEHVREDRDQYITVMWDNIKPGKISLDAIFAKQANTQKTVTLNDGTSISAYITVIPTTVTPKFDVILRSFKF